MKLFTFWGAPNAGLSWPGRYSHAPAEVLDLRDLVGLHRLTLIAKKREQSSAKVLTKEPLGLCLERCFQTKHQTTRGPYSALETISISPELQQGSSDRVHRAEPELVWWTGTVFTIFAPR